MHMTVLELAWCEWLEIFVLACSWEEESQPFTAGDAFHIIDTYSTDAKGEKPPEALKGYHIIRQLHRLIHIV